MVKPYIEVHKEFLRSQNPGKNEAWITRQHMETLDGWLQKEYQRDQNIDEQLYLLARQPSWHILMYNGYEINGNTFYTVAQDKRSTNQNSGVSLDATDPDGNKHTYYGRIEEIWELDYATDPNFKVPLFRCQWVKGTGGGVKVDKEYGMATVDLNNTGYKDDPFVLAAEVNQVFYVKDMSTKSKRGKNDDKSTNEPKRHIVLTGKRNNVGIEDKSDMSEDYEKDERIPPFSVTTDPSILLNAEDVLHIYLQKWPTREMTTWTMP
jgi:hypothetical protein